MRVVLGFVFVFFVVSIIIWVLTDLETMLFRRPMTVERLIFVIILCGVGWNGFLSITGR